MAGAAYTTTVPTLKNPRDVIGTFPIKSGEIINQGDLVALDSNFQVIAASKTQGAIVEAQGIAFFDDDNSTGGARTGVAALTVKTGICKKARIGNLTTTLVPALAGGGTKKVFLGPVPTATVSNYTCTQSTTAGDKIQLVGQVVSASEIEVDINWSGLAYQAAATSTAVLG
jgi:hypothetical protein